jgi:hypothetical protein
MNEPAVIRTFSLESEAIVASTVLSGAGVENRIVSDDAGGAYASLPFGSGYNIVIDKADLEKATEALSSASAQLDENTDVGKRETEPEQSSISWQWYFFLGIGIGIVMGLVSYWGYWKTKSVIGVHYKFEYQGGLVTKATRDRNHDGKRDYWTYYRDGDAYRTEADNNFDGKVDDWTTFIREDSSVSKADVDSNGVPDITCEYKNGVLTKIWIHPNNEKRVFMLQYYSNGLLDSEFVSYDSSGVFDKKISFDRFMNITSEQKLRSLGGR